jgi:hypothetical protein
MFSTGWEDLSGEVYGLEIPDFYNLSNSADIEAGLREERYRTTALFYDLNLEYADMVFLEVSGRQEWSTTLPEENNSAFYPSANLGFVYTELPGIRGNPVLSFGKIRGSVARTGNLAFPYLTERYYTHTSTGDGWTTGVSFPWMGTTGYRVSYYLRNQSLGNETMTSFELGTDLRFLIDRFGIDFTYFRNKNTDLLMRIPVIYTFGYEWMYTNAGEMQTRGYELVLSGRILTGQFNWDIHVNWTKMTNSVNALAENVGYVGLGGFTYPHSRAVAGTEYGTIYGFDWYRDENGIILINDDPLDAYRDGYPMPDEREMVAIGNPNPDWQLNIINTFSYKGVSLSALLDIRKGGQMYNGTAYAMNYFGTHERTVNREVAWTPYGTVDFANTPVENIVVYDGIMGHFDNYGNPISSGIQNTIPVVNDEDFFEGYGSNFGGGPSWAAIEPADWIRLREITLSYTFPKNLLGKTFSQLQVYFTGRNLYLWTPYTGVDPETNLMGNSNAQGFDYFNMPGTKTYTLGVKLSF